ncbi:MAG: hypothetical protein WEA56_17205 [Balneolaceae bacterium]
MESRIMNLRFMDQFTRWNFIFLFLSFLFKSAVIASRLLISKIKAQVPVRVAWLPGNKLGSRSRYK